MTPKSLRKIEVLAATDAILNVLQDAKEPISAADLSKMTGLSSDSCFRQLGTMTDLRWVEKISEGYVIGMRLALIWARRKSLAQGKLHSAEKELNELAGGDE